MKRASDSSPDDRPVSLKMVAERLGLSPATVSLVVNNAPGSKRSQ
jgi:Mn-dependent DtxR family transcriptional regulator